MVALRLIPLYAYQKVHLENILKIVNVENLWSEFSSCCSSLGEIKHDKSSAINFIARGGCAYYYYLLSVLKSDDNLSFLVANPSPESLFRHVYLYVEKGEPVILSKGSLWFGDESQCRNRAVNYTPSIDITPQGHMLLTVENCHPHFPRISHPLQKEHNAQSFTSDGNYCQHVTLENEVLVKMPWQVESEWGASKPMFVFCLQSVDTWFYSFSGDLLTAYHEHIHRS